MTVCIGAICADKKALIVASDRMVTSSMPPIKFEHTKRKIIPISNNCVALFAGNALIPIKIIPMIKEMLSNNSSIGKIAEDAKNLFQMLRSQTAEDLILKTKTISKEIFYTKGASIFPPDLFRQVDYDFTNYDLGIQLMIGGVDNEAHLFGITHPGTLNCFDDISFHAIGIGSLHAIQVFIAHDYKVSYNIEETLNIVYAAKKSAESAPGVGRETDISIIQTNGTINIEDKIINELQKIYNETRKPIIEEIKEKSAKLKKLLKAKQPEKKDETKLQSGSEKEA